MKSSIHGSLTEEFQPKILSFKMSFQLKKKKRNEPRKKNRYKSNHGGTQLIDDKPEEVIDLSSIKELTQTRYEIKMTSFDYTTSQS